MHAIILAGGKGSRLWPITSDELPKPFLKINSNLSLLQNTYIRARSLKNIFAITTIANKNFIKKIHKEYLSIENINHPYVKTRFISEPAIKNTAPAITASIVQICKLYGENELVIVLPSDHIIQDDLSFKKSVDIATKHANYNKIVMFGIKPSRADTNYGYIKYKDNQVLEFIEKPSYKEVINYVENEEYLWNSGILCFKAGIFIEEMQKHAPDTLIQINNCVNLSKISNQNDYIEFKLDKNSFMSVKNISIDFELIEKSKNLAVVPADFDWRDIGNWYSLSEIYNTDKNGNTINGNANIQDTYGCYIENNEKNISIIGAKNLAIINSSAGLLIVDKAKTANVSNVFPTRKNQRKEKFFWGELKQFSEYDGPKIFELFIYPKVYFKISDYFKNIAHWMIISGTAEFSSNKSIETMNANQSKYLINDPECYINNIGTDPLIILSIQTEDYLLKNNIIQTKCNAKNLA